MNISLPESLRAWVLEQVDQGGFSSVSEYLRHVLREEQKRQQQSLIDQRLLAGLASAESVPMSPAAWNELRQEARRRAKSRKRK